MYRHHQINESYTPDGEPGIKGFYKDYRKDPDPCSDSAGITT